MASASSSVAVTPSACGYDKYRVPEGQASAVGQCMASVAGSPRAWGSDGDRDPEDEASAIGQCMASVPIEGSIRGAWLLGFDRRLVASLGAQRQIDKRLIAANGWGGETDMLEKWGRIIFLVDATGFSSSNGDVHNGS